jgi:hypothetical protein
MGGLADRQSTGRSFGETVPLSRVRERISMALPDPHDTTPLLDDGAYRWLETHQELITGLDPDRSRWLYTSTLEKISSEGQIQLARAGTDDPVLTVFLLRLVAEALLDLGLVATDVANRDELLQECLTHCTRALEVLNAQAICGLSASVLPRVVSILAVAYQNISPGLKAPLGTGLGEVVDLLDHALQQVDMARQQAVENLFQARFLAANLGDLHNASDRHLVLAKAAGFSRAALLGAQRAFDTGLASQAEETLAAIEKSLAAPGLPAPVLPQPAGEIPDPLAAVEKYLETRRCARCGSLVTDGVKFCRKCGAPAPRQPSAQTHPDVPVAGWSLCPQGGPLAGKTFPMVDGLTIGRSPDNGLAIADSELSRRHASIERIGAEWRIVDLGSRNGVYVNGARVLTAALLHPGDSITLGQTRLRVTDVGGPPVAALVGAQCTHCSAPLKPGKKFCGTCGAPVSLVQPSIQLPASPVCPQCGKTLKPGAKFCGRCGRPL